MTKTITNKLNLAKSLKSIGSIKVAISILSNIVNEDPSNIEARIELAFSLWEVGDHFEAYDLSNNLLMENSTNPYLQMLSGHILRDMNRCEESIAAYKAAIQLSPNNSSLHHALALCFKEFGYFQRALDEYQIAYTLDENNSELHNNIGILHLLTGKYEFGFYEYEWRKKKIERYGERDFSQPLWQGEDLEGKILLIHHEQGLGDAIQFSRYVKLLIDKGIHILYAAHPPLRRLLSSMGDLEFVIGNEPGLKFDYHCPLLSLPLRLGTTVETIPAEIPYLYAETDRIKKWRDRIGQEGFKIGLAWQGSGGRHAKNRLFPLSYLKPLMNYSDVRLIGLHKSHFEHPWELPDGLKIENLGFDFDAGPDAFLDAAAAIAYCDLIITCDTSIAHLAGALGMSTWVVLRCVPHWVWMMERVDSPWYPTARLFRQKSPGDWQSAFDELYAELDILLNERTILNS